VAAISTLIVLAALNYVGQVGQSIELVRRITYFLSISGRANTFISGLITTRDILYFIFVILLFLAFTYLKLQSERESRSQTSRSVRYGGYAVIILLLIYFTSLPK